LNTSTILDVIVRCTRDVVPELQTREIQATDSLAELGANSIDRAEIVMMVVESLQLQVQRTELFGPNNLGELADLLHRKLHGT
jgi:polyketide biosynthesis acyl carrier protein